MRVFHIKFILAGHWWGNLILHTPPPSHKRKKERIKDTYTAKASHSSFYIIIYCRIVAYVALSDLLKYFCHPFTLQFLFEEHILEQCIVKFFVFFFSSCYEACVIVLCSYAYSVFLYLKWSISFADHTWKSVMQWTFSFISSSSL